MKVNYLKKCRGLVYNPNKILSKLVIKMNINSHQLY
jgi:hypothetical protein